MSDEEDVVCACCGTLLCHEKEWIMPFAATWMDPEVIILSEISQTEKDNIIWHHLYVDSKKWYNWTYVQNGNRLTDIEHKDGYQRG